MLNAAYKLAIHGKTNIIKRNISMPNKIHCATYLITEYFLALFLGGRSSVTHRSLISFFSDKTPPKPQASSISKLYLPEWSESSPDEEQDSN